MRVTGLELAAWGVVVFLILLQLTRFGFKSHNKHQAFSSGGASIISEATHNETVKSNRDSINLMSYPASRNDPLLRVYVYENLPAELTTDIEQCQFVEGIQGVWKKRSNFMADIPIINLFKNYHGRTLDPSEADIFVVPYPHKSHCICNLKLQRPQKLAGLHCPQVPEKDIDLLISSLTFFNETTANRHLFILSGDFGWSNKHLEMMPLLLTLGPKPENRPGAIVIPYLNDRPEFQPSAIQQRSDAWWTTRPRKYSFVYFFGGADIRKIRGNFQRLVRDEYNLTLGGLPFVMKSIRNWTPTEQDFVYEMYRQSIFCPCLAGDNAPQKRFFDVAMSGCLPVVISYNQSRHPDWNSWFRQGGPSVKASYPFSRGNFNGDGSMEIDYESFVVQVPDSIANIKTVLEGILADPEDLRRRQKSLQKYASFFSYGTTSDGSYQYHDAFSGIIHSLRQYQNAVESGEIAYAPLGLAKKSLPNMQDGPRRPHLSRHQLSRFIVVPEFKLLFCYVEKVGCSMFNHLFRMLRIHQPEVFNNPNELERQANHTWKRNTPRSHNITKEGLEELLVDPNWTKAVFYRDPVSRFLSAYRSKCESGHDHLYFCKKLYGNRSVTFDDVLTYVKNKKLRQNVHTLPMSRFCGGLGSTIDYYDFVRELDPRTAPNDVTELLNKIGVDKMLTNQLVERIVRSGGTNITEDEDFVAKLGVQLKHDATQNPSHNTGSSNTSGVCEYYRSDENINLIQELYSVDYETFQFTPKQYQCSF